MKGLLLTALLVMAGGRLLAQNPNEVNRADVENLKKAKTEDAKPDSSRFWKRGSVIAVNMANTGLVNWQGGGQDAFTISSLYTGFANYSRGKNEWANRLEMGYGITRLGGGSGGTKSVLRKSDDRFIFTSKYGRLINKNWGFAGLFDFRSQFDKGYKYDVDVKDADGKVIGKRDEFISDFLSPAFSIASLGFEYKTGDVLYAMISPVTGKFTFVENQQLADSGAYGVQRGKHFRSEFGAYFNSTFKYQLMQNVGYNTTLNLFMNYKHPELIDVFWDNTLTLTVNKYLQATFTTNLIYDDDIKIKQSNGSEGPRIQFKHVLAVGLTIKM